MWKCKHLTIAERQKHLNQICMIAEYIVPIVVAAVTAAIISFMELR